MRKDRTMPFIDTKNMRTVSASEITTASPDCSAIAMDFSSRNSWTSNMTLHITSQTAEVAKVIYNEPATIVLWRDGTKTVVKCHPDDYYDPEKGFLLCCAKKLLGGGKYNDVMRKHVPPRSETVLKALKKALGIKDES